MIDGSEFGGRKAGKLLATQFVLGSRAQDKNDRFLFALKTGVLTFDVDGKGGKKAILIADLNTSITAASITVL